MYNGGLSWLEVVQKRIQGFTRWTLDEGDLLEVSQEAQEDDGNLVVENLPQSPTIAHQDHDP